MGTVGLSFGSPTSGAGFNVSTTVASIVSNLQNVETPWKTQLTTLGNEDTTISSLGTLVSNLSTDMSNLTDLQGVLAEKTGSSSDTNVLELTSASSSAVAGTHTVVVNSLAQTSSGVMAELTNSSDTLSGSITLQVGTGTAQTITLNSGNNTLAGLASAINASGAGITASVLTDANGSRLSLVSSSSGAAGNITVYNNSITAAVANTLTYTGTAGTGTAYSTGTLSPVAAAGDSLSGSISVQVGSGTAQTINMSDVQTATGGTTLADLQQYIYNNSATLGFTASVVTNGDGTSSLSLSSGTAGSAGTLTVNSSISDTATALNYISTVTGSNASLTVDGVNLTSASNTVTNLIPGLTFQLLSTSPSESGGGLEPVQVVIGNDNTGVESTISQMVSDYNSLISAIGAQEGNTSSGTPEPLFGSPTLSLLQQQILGGINAQNPNGYLDSVSSASNVTLSGSLTIEVGSGTTQTVVVGDAPSPPVANTIYTGSSNNTLAGIATAINNANIGVTAAVTTANGESSLTFTSGTDGSSGDLAITSSLSSTTPTELAYTDSNGYTSTTADSGSLNAVTNAGDTLAGSMTIQVGTGTAQTITLDSTDNTISGLMTAINNANLGVTASLDSTGTVLTLTSATDGAAGALNVTSNIGDSTTATTTALNYNKLSDVNTLTDLGISVNNDGSLTYDANSLDSLLNTDFSGVVGFFQNSNSWGQSFSTMLTNAGTSSPTGILALASSSNNSIESSLNAEISKEQTYISAQQSSLTTELNSANEIMQEIPTQLQGVNELYSAISGYNENSNE